MFSFAGRVSWNVSWNVRKEGRRDKKTSDVLILNLITLEVGNEVLKGKTSPSNKIVAFLVDVLSSFSPSFFLAPGSFFFFWACSHCSSCKRPPWRLLFLFYLFYFVFFFIWFYSIISLVITYIYYSIPIYAINYILIRNIHSISFCFMIDIQLGVTAFA